MTSLPREVYAAFDAPEEKQASKPNPHDEVAKLFREDYVFGTVLLTACFDRWGDDRNDDDRVDFLSWHPGTVNMEFEKTFGVALSQGNFDRLMAAIVIFTTDLFFKNLRAFVHLCNVLAGSEFTPEDIDLADAHECAWGITEGLLLVPPDEDDPEPFSDEIRSYVGLALKYEGFISAPDIMRIATGYDQKNWVLRQHHDNPELLQTIADNQKEKSEELKDLIKEGMVEMVGQLKRLHLRHGSIEGLEQRVQNLQDTF